MIISILMKSVKLCETECDIELPIKVNFKKNVDFVVEVGCLGWNKTIFKFAVTFQ